MPANMIHIEVPDFLFDIMGNVENIINRGTGGEDGADHCSAQANARAYSRRNHHRGSRCPMFQRAASKNGPFAPKSSPSSSAAAANGNDEIANSETHFSVSFDLAHFDASEITVKMDEEAGDMLTVNATHESNAAEDGYEYRQYTKSIAVPRDVVVSEMRSRFDSESGKLQIDAPRKVVASATSERTIPIEFVKSKIEKKTTTTDKDDEANGGDWSKIDNSEGDQQEMTLD